MLKQLVLLLLVGVSFNLYGSESYHLNGAHDYSGLTLGRMDPDTSLCVIPSKDVVDKILRDSVALKLFEATERLLSVLPRKKSECVCLCYDTGEFDSIKLHISDYYNSISTPWENHSIETISDRLKVCEIVRRNGLEFTEVKFMGSSIGIEIIALDGESLPKISYSAPERCAMFAAWKLYGSAKERAARRWSPARRAWVGSVVRSGNARKPFEVAPVVAAELKE